MNEVNITIQTKEVNERYDYYKQLAELEWPASKVHDENEQGENNEIISRQEQT